MLAWLDRKTLGIRFNWFTVGFHCWRKGHQWRKEPSLCYSLTVCAWCGRYGGKGDGSRGRCVRLDAIVNRGGRDRVGLGQILRSAPGPDPDGGIELTDQEFASFLEAARGTPSTDDRSTP